MPPSPTHFRHAPSVRAVPRDAAAPRQALAWPAPPRLALAELPARLRRLVAEAGSNEPPLEAFTSLARELTDALLVAAAAPPSLEAAALPADASAEARAEALRVTPRLLALAEEAASRGATRVERVEGASAWVLAAIPLEESTHRKNTSSADLANPRDAAAAPERAPPRALVAAFPGKAALRGEAPALDARLLALHHVALSIARARGRRLAEEWAWAAQAGAAAVEVVAAIARHDRLAPAALEAAALARKLVGARRVAIGARQSSGACRVVALSDTPRFDRRLPGVAEIAAALEETALRAGPSLDPASEGLGRHALLAHRRLRESQQAECVFSLPLTTADGAAVGAWLFLGDQATLGDVRPQRLIAALATPVAEALAAAKTREGDWPTRLARGVGKRWPSLWKTGAVIATLAALALAIPWPHRLTGACAVEPVERRYAVAPFAGLLEETTARAGEVVSAGQTLARMEGREIRWELAGLQAERGRAAKQRDVALARQDIAAAQQAALELRRLELKIQLWERRARQLEIASPRAGVVLSAALEDAAGAPVQTGQPLFEIAPLERVRLELAIPAEDVRHARIGQTLRAHVRGLPGEEFSGEVEWLSPAAEARDGDSVFICRAVVENPRGALRPGMRGEAALHVGERPLGWIWLHKAHETLLRTLGW